MPLVLWDASGLAKRYVTEIGTETVNALFTFVPTSQMILPMLGYAETYSILLRRFNDRRLDAATFTAATLALENEVLNDPGFALLSLNDAAVLESISLMRLHHLNSSDGVILAGLLHYARSLGPDTLTCILVAADRRLLRAAQAEGIMTLNPEMIAAADVPAVLAAL